MLKTMTSLLALSMISVALGAHADNDPPKVAPEGARWSTGPGFKFDSREDKKRESLSGIACPSPSTSPRLCVAAFDEGGEARYVLIERDHLVPQPNRIVLLAEDQELD